MSFLSLCYFFHFSNSLKPPQKKMAKSKTLDILLEDAVFLRKIDFCQLPNSSSIELKNELVDLKFFYL